MENLRLYSISFTNEYTGVSLQHVEIDETFAKGFFNFTNVHTLETNLGLVKFKNGGHRLDPTSV